MQTRIVSMLSEKYGDAFFWLFDKIYNMVDYKKENANTIKKKNFAQILIECESDSVSDKQAENKISELSYEKKLLKTVSN